MSNLRRSSRPGPGPSNGLLPLVASAPQPRLRSRWPLIALAALVVVLALAWFDGGEEPLRPIAQTVELAEPQS